MTAATPEACEDALIVVHGALGLGPATSEDRTLNAKLEEEFYQRINEQARILAVTGWTSSMLKATIPALAVSPELDDKIRYGRPITAADFERVRRNGYSETKVRDEADGVSTERVLVTRSGYALRVARARLYDYAEAMGLWRAGGEVGHFSTDHGRYPDGMFEAVKIEGKDKPMWRLK